MSVDDDLAAWIAGLDDLFALVAGRFFRIEPRLRAGAYVRGLLAPLASKNGWTLAEAAGDATPDGMQRLLNRAAWDAGGVRDDVRAYVAGHLGSADGVLVVDETGFLKKGARSAGVQRQYSGRAGTSRADVLAARAPEQAWKRRSCGAGAKGPRMFDWAVASLPCHQDTTPPGWSRWLLVRRALTRNAKGELELAYYLCCAPAGTTDEDLIRVAGSRWAIEECFATAKTETGLDQYQVRRYDAWYRHITLAMLAHAYLSVTAAIAPKALAAASSRSHSARYAVSWHT